MVLLSLNGIWSNLAVLFISFVILFLFSHFFFVPFVKKNIEAREKFIQLKEAEILIVDNNQNKIQKEIDEHLLYTSKEKANLEKDGERIAQINIENSKKEVEKNYQEEYKKYNNKLNLEMKNIDQFLLSIEDEIRNGITEAIKKRSEKYRN